MENGLGKALTIPVAAGIILYLGVEAAHYRRK